MKYALINEKNEVLEIKETEILNSNPNFSVVKLNAFEEGDEIQFYIVVNEVNELGEVASYSAVKQTPYIKNLLQENSDLKSRLEVIEAATEELILGGAM